MAKETTSFRVEREIAKKLKIWEVETDQKTGDVLAQLVEMAEQQAEEKRNRLYQARLTSYLTQPTLSLALMTDNEIAQMIGAPATTTSEGSER